MFPWIAEFERAAQLRDRIVELQQDIGQEVSLSETTSSSAQKNKIGEVRGVVDAFRNRRSNVNRLRHTAVPGATGRMSPAGRHLSRVWKWTRRALVDLLSGTSE